MAATPNYLSLNQLVASLKRIAKFNPEAQCDLQANAVKPFTQVEFSGPDSFSHSRRDISEKWNNYSLVKNKDRYTSRVQDLLKVLEPIAAMRKTDCTVTVRPSRDDGRTEELLYKNGSISLTMAFGEITFGTEFECPVVQNRNKEDVEKNIMYSFAPLSNISWSGTFINPYSQLDIATRLITSKSLSAEQCHLVLSAFDIDTAKCNLFLIGGKLYIWSSSNCGKIPNIVDDYPDLKAYRCDRPRIEKLFDHYNGFYILRAPLEKFVECFKTTNKDELIDNLVKSLEPTPSTPIQATIASTPIQTSSLTSSTVVIPTLEQTLSTISTPVINTCEWRVDSKNHVIERSSDGTYIIRPI